MADSSEALEPVLSEHFQGRVRSWLRVVTVMSVLAAILAPPWGEHFWVFAMILPFAHCGLLWAVLFLRSFPDPWMGPSSLYIKYHHPDLWKRLHPWGDLSRAPACVSRTYGDDVGDPHLQLILERSRQLMILYVWPFGLILVCWLIATPIYFALGLKR